jgi:hypothetical protein
VRRLFGRGSGDDQGPALNTLLRAALRPWQGFPLREARWPQALGRMLAIRTPWAVLEGLLMWRAFGLMRAEVVSMEGPLWKELLPNLSSELSTADLKGLLNQIPTLPPLSQAWPWIVLSAPLLMISAWAHHAVWDHTFLWLLKGVAKDEKPFRRTLAAEAQALEVGVLAAALGLLQYLPALGPVLGLPLGLVGLWFWGLRGFALAQAHGAPAWKGVLATVLHALVAGCCLLACLFILMLELSLAAAA